MNRNCENLIKVNNLRYVINEALIKVNQICRKHTVNKTMKMNPFLYIRNAVGNKTELSRYYPTLHNCMNFKKSFQKCKNKLSALSSFFTTLGQKESDGNDGNGVEILRNFEYFIRVFMRLLY